MGNESSSPSSCQGEGSSPPPRSLAHRRDRRQQQIVRPGNYDGIPDLADGDRLEISNPFQGAGKVESHFVFVVESRTFEQFLGEASPLRANAEGQPLQSNVIINGYTLEERLGSGAFGSVWKAKHDQLQDVAVKFMLLDEEHKEVVLNEAKQYVELSNSCDYLLSTKGPPFVLEKAQCQNSAPILVLPLVLCKGDLLRATMFFRENRRASILDEVKEVAWSVAKGLKFLHGNRKLHRDVKPENILVSQSDQYILGDMGLVRMLQNDRDYTVNLMGTRAYCAPEVLWESKMFPKCDIWALGITLLELVRGHRFYEWSESKAHMPPGLWNHVQPGVWDELTDSVPDEQLKKVIRGCLKVSVEERWDADAVLDELGN